MKKKSNFITGYALLNITNYNKIIILGNAGSGKSWLAKKLGEITGYEVIHLDNLFWKPGWTKTPREEWITIQEHIMQKDKCIIDGNYESTLDTRFKAADLIIFFDTNRFHCLFNAIKRNGKKRSDLPEYLEEKIDREFFDFCKWILNYNKNGKAIVLNTQKEYSHKPFIMLKNRKGVSNFLKEITYE